MDALKTLLVHPDCEVRADLRARLSRAGFIRVVGEAVSAFEALELVDALPYAAVFVGAELAGEVSGLEFAQMLAARKKKLALVFVAGDESFAYKAYELGAADYLLYPFAQERFERTLERLKTSRRSTVPMPEPSWRGPTPDTGEQTLHLDLAEDEEDRFLTELRQAWDPNRSRRPLEMDKLPIPQDGRTIFLPYTAIVFVEAYEDYSFVHTATQKYLTSYRVKNLEERLKPHRFFRVHRKYLVNMEMVTEIATQPGGQSVLRTAGKTKLELPISRRRVSELKNILGL